MATIPAVSAASMPTSASSNTAHCVGGKLSPMALSEKPPDEAYCVSVHCRPQWHQSNELCLSFLIQGMRF
jgi:hypothetical protein